MFVQKGKEAGISSYVPEWKTVFRELYNYIETTGVYVIVS
jgi:hypothetical protein